ncbi:MAG: M20/M25/M40 family metallo-hydrolase [Acidobacteriota bacterium]
MKRLMWMQRIPATSGVLTRAAAVCTTALVVLVGCGSPGGEPAGDAASTDEQAATESSVLLEAAREAQTTIRTESLRPHIAVLSDDAMEGRAPGTPGDDKAQEYLIEQMQQLGLEPGGPDGQWRQSFDIVSIESTVPETWAFTKDGDNLTLAWWDDFIASSGVQAESATLDGAEVVFVGYGIDAPEYEWNDFGDTDLSGKVLLIVNNDPDWDPELFEGDRRLYYGRWTYKYEAAAARGAAGAIIIHTRPSAGYPFGVVQSSWTGPQFELPAGDEPRLQVAAWTSEDATRRLLEFAGQDYDTLVEQAKSRDFTPVPLGVSTSLAIETTLERTQTANVLGKLAGSDPEIGDEIVLYGAHFDHLGVGRADDAGDTIYNGALDNAAGSAAVLAVAQSFLDLPEAPRRSVVFAFWGAEESGLLGSKHFGENPTVAPGKIAANLNIDGGNIWGVTDDVVFIGHGKSDLDAVVERHAAAQERHVVGDQFPDRGYFYRSDQLNLARIGVPAVYLDTGTEFRDRPAGWGKEQLEAWEGASYHQPSDELEDSWVFDGMIADTRLLFLIGVDLAEQTALPRWTPGDEFEAARTAALARVE